MGNSHKLTLVAGPCLIEDDHTPFQIAKHIKSLVSDLPIEFIFKASYRKANRTSLSSFQGIGDEVALKIIKQIGRDFGIRTLTDVHESTEVLQASEYVDVIQIPAFLCRQTDLLIAAGNTGKTISIKKGQFVSPEAMKFPLEKVQSTGNKDVWLCERGFSFGYNELVVDATAIVQLKAHGVPVLMDCTHALQKPNLSSGVTGGGDPKLIETLALSAIATGANGLFIETYPNPSQAKSDGLSMLELKYLEPILEKALAIRESLQRIKK